MDFLKTCSNNEKCNVLCIGQTCTFSMYSPNSAL